METGTQKVGKKKIKKCAQIVGKPVVSGYVNGTLPHYIIMAFVSPREAYLVNIKKLVSWPYITDGRFVMRRASDIIVEQKEYKPRTEIVVEGEYLPEEVVFTPEGRAFDNWSDVS